MYYTKVQSDALFAHIVGAAVENNITTFNASGDIKDSGTSLSSVVGGMKYQGVWNATTNTPTLASGAGTQGYYYVVSVAGSTNLDGITDWVAGDWAVYNGAAWQKIDNTDQVSSVFGRTGAVVAAINDYTWAQVDKTTSDIADITTKSHTSLTDIGTNAHSAIDSHIANVTTNPHAVDAADVAAIPNATFTAAAETLRGTGAGTYEAVKNNNSASDAPDANDDTTGGYSVGSRWVDTTADKEYICLDATSANAVWKETTQSAGTVEGTAVLSTGEVGGTKYLREDGDGTCSWQTPAGAGDVVGPATHAASYFPKWNATPDSKTLVEGVAGGNSNGNVVLRSADNAIAANTISEVSAGSGVAVDSLTIKDAGFALGSDADGDIYYRASGALARLAKGTAKQTIVMNAGATAPEYQDGTTGVYRTVPVMAGAMVSRTTNGAAAGSNEYATNDVMMDYFAFDGGATEEAVQFQLVMPDEWDLGTLKVKCFWTSATGSTAGDTVEWGIRARAVSNDDALDGAWGTAVTVSDTLLANDGADNQTTAATAALTVGGTPVLGDLIFFEVYRNTDGTDDMTEDAWLAGIQIQYKESTTPSSAW